jgi:phage gp46-like protein
MDLRLSFNPATFRSDIILANGQLVTDGGLQSAVTISLFTDKRWDGPVEMLPDYATPENPGSQNRRGWWGDFYTAANRQALLNNPGLSPPPAPTGRWGSHLWLLSRMKQTQENVNRAQRYAAQALQWLLDDGVANTVKVVADVPAPGWLRLRVWITQPSAPPASFTFQSAWADLGSAA